MCSHLSLISSTRLSIRSCANDEVDLDGFLDEEDDTDDDDGKDVLLNDHEIEPPINIDRNNKSNSTC